MRRLASCLVLLCLASLAVVTAQDKPAEPLVGSWAGTFAGEASGKYTMSIQRESADKLAGSIVTIVDGGNESEAAFTSVALDGGKAVMKYGTSDGQAEIVMEATLEGEAIKGTWKAVAPGTADALQSGTFDGTKKCNCN